MGNALRFVQDIEVRSTDCIYCGYDILMSASFMRTRKNDHKNFHCTSCGGVQHWLAGSSEVERLRAEMQKKIDEQARVAEWHRNQAANERNARERSERSNRAIRGAATRMRNRIKNGVCPCCNRTFIDLQRHMTTKHPDFRPSHVVTDPPPPAGAVESQS